MSGEDRVGGVVCVCTNTQKNEMHVDPKHPPTFQYKDTKKTSKSHRRPFERGGGRKKEAFQGFGDFGDFDGFGDFVNFGNFGGFGDFGDFVACTQSGARKDEGGTPRQHRQGGEVCRQMMRKVWMSIHMFMPKGDGKDDAKGQRFEMDAKLVFGTLWVGVTRTVIRVI